MAVYLIILNILKYNLFNFKALYFNYRIIHIRPLQPSFIIFSMVSPIFALASDGILYNLLCSPSLTSSCTDLPKILLSQIFSGFSSNSFKR